MLGSAGARDARWCAGNAGGGGDDERCPGSTGPGSNPWDIIHRDSVPIE